MIATIMGYQSARLMARRDSAKPLANIASPSSATGSRPDWIPA